MSASNNVPEFNIRGQLRQFIPIEQFRQTQQLADDFAIALFQPKNYDGLGSIEGAGAALRHIHDSVLAAIPTHSPLSGWIAFTLELQILFRRLLVKVNGQVGLKVSEVDFAVVNFGTICQAYLNNLLSSRIRGQPILSFSDVYQNWLNKTIEISLPYSYPHQDTLWQVEIIKHAYGRFALIIQTAIDVYYVYDGSLSCPAERFMETLSRATAERISTVFLGQDNTRQI